MMRNPLALSSAQALSILSLSKGARGAACVSKGVVAAIILLAMIACSPVLAQQRIPQDSMARLQDTFTDLRDRLWNTNDSYWHRGEFDRCIATMRLITRMDPRDTEAYIDAAWLMFSDVREEDAEAFLREGLANNTNSYDMYFELGNFCYMRTRYDEAIPLLAAAVSFDCPRFVWHQLAHAYEHAGRTGECLETWFEIQAMEPDNPVVPMNIDRILSGDGPSGVPDNMLKSIRQRQADRAKGRD